MPKGHLTGGFLGDAGSYTGGGKFTIQEARNFRTTDTWRYTGLITSGLIWHLDATNASSYPGTGTTWFDISGSGLNATGASAITGQALQQNQPYTTASTSALDINTHSLFFSLQISGFSGNWDKIFGYDPAGTDRSPGIWRYPSDRRIHWRYDPNNTGDQDLSVTAMGPYDVGGTAFAITTWYYVGIVKAGATTYGYVNGIPIGIATNAANPKTPGASTLKLFPGYTAGTPALMRHVHLYNRALSLSEIRNNYNAIKANLP
jgi:hypothetical protein